MLKGSLMEAERVSDLHTIMKDSLLNIVSAKVKDWQKENYKTQLIGGSKPASTFADEFKKVYFTVLKVAVIWCISLNFMHLVLS